MPKRQFYIPTADHSGLPLANRFIEEGDRATLVLIRPEERNGKWEIPKTPDERKKNVERVKYLEKNGNGLVDKMWASEAMTKIGQKDYTIFDQIYGWQYGELLWNKRMNVLGGLKVGFLLEKNRQDTLSMLKNLGMDVPWGKYFGPQSSQKGVVFLKNSKDDRLFVFKSDNPKVLTKVAQDTNDELIQKLEVERKDIDRDGFLLQEKKEGIEFAIESWISNGKLIFANVDIEAKKKYNEMGEIQTGCAFGLTWPIPVDHPLRERVNGPLDKFAAKFIGTGLYDLSVIYDHKEDKMWALEMCGSRFPYNAFYALMALSKIPLGEFFANYLDGKYTSDIGQKLFEDRFSASLRVFNDDKTPDQRIEIPKEYRHNFWLWDCYKKGGELFTTGTDLGESLGIITATGENPEGAFAEIRKMFHKLHMPTKFARDDFDEEDSQGLPLSRYHQMKRLKLI